MRDCNLGQLLLNAPLSTWVDIAVAWLATASLPWLIIASFRRLWRWLNMHAEYTDRVAQHGIEGAGPSPAYRPDERFRYRVRIDWKRSVHLATVALVGLTAIVLAAGIAASAEQGRSGIAAALMFAVVLLVIATFRKGRP